MKKNFRNFVKFSELEIILSSCTKKDRDNKAENISMIDVKNKSSVTDTMIIVSGRSTRHVKAIADNLVTKLKKNKVKPIGIEGYNKSEWILLDYGDLLVHVMHPEARAFYSLEKLWDESIEIDNYTFT